MTLTRVSIYIISGQDPPYTMQRWHVKCAFAPTITYPYISNVWFLLQHLRRYSQIHWALMIPCGPLLSTSPTHHASQNYHQGCDGRHARGRSHQPRRRAQKWTAAGTIGTPKGEGRQSWSTSCRAEDWEPYLAGNVWNELKSFELKPMLCCSASALKTSCGNYRFSCGVVML